MREGIQVHHTSAYLKRPSACPWQPCIVNCSSLWNFFDTYLSTWHSHLPKGEMEWNIDGSWT